MSTEHEDGQEEGLNHDDAEGSSSPRAPEPTAEELKLKADIEATRKLVQFKKAELKDIVSHHSSSILSKDDPEVPHDSKLEELSRQAFQTSPSLKDGYIPCSIPDLISVLQNCGFGYLSVELPSEVADRLSSYLKKLTLEILSHQRKDALSISSTSATMNENEFLQLVQKFNAPAFYFGQRLRRLVARAQLPDAILLILRGCNANTSDGEGLSSIHYACEYNRYELIESIHNIVKDDLVINGQDKYGWTPLHCACHHGNIACVELLLKLGASVTNVNKQGKTPFHLASAQCRSEIVALLLQHDASVVNIKDNMDMTALIDAAFRGHKTVYYQLLEVEGIDVNHKDRLGYSAADYFEGRAIPK